MTTRAAVAARLPVRRALTECEASVYMGVGVLLFRQMVLDGRVLRPRLVHNRAGQTVRTWDVAELDAAYASLPREGDAATGEVDTWADFSSGRGSS